MLPPVAESPNDLITSLENEGFAFVRGLVSASLIDQLRTLCSATLDIASVARRGDSVYGIRNLLTAILGVREIVSGAPLIEWVVAVSGQSARPVNGVFFDKTSGANWPIPWHQDVTICVRQRVDVPGFEPRPVKDGMVHLLPPRELSQQILTLRIHLDDASAAHGAVRVIPGSHRQGRLSNPQIEQMQATMDAVSCEAMAGDVMFMRPLLLHASSPCEVPVHRRVIQIEYAAFDLPGGLEWQDSH